jgi:hypothetical protein
MCVVSSRSAASQRKFQSRLSKEKYMSFRTTLATALSLALAITVIGCGGSNNTPAFTQDQASAATDDIFEALATASASAGFAREGDVKAEVAALRGATPSAEIQPYSSTILPEVRPLTTTTVTIAPYTFACPAGGNIVVSGSAVGTFSGSSESQSINVVESINKCADDGFVINGAPNVTISGNFNENTVNNTTTANEVVTIAGGFTSGNSSCSINVTVTATASVTANGSETATATVAGSVCGTSINSSGSI